MSKFVMSLQRLYNQGLITKEKVTSLLNDNKINQEEYDYILSDI